MRRQRVGGWAGMAAPVLFTAVFTIEGALRPGYQAQKMFVSALSLGPRGWVQISSFVVMGALSLLFAMGVAAEFREGKASRAGPVLLYAIGASFLLSGPIVMDPFGTPPKQMTWHGMLHGILGALVFSLSPVVCFVFFRRFREDPAWRPLQWWTLAAGVVIVVAVALLRVGEVRPGALPNGLTDWIGLIQRVALIGYLAWVFGFAVRLQVLIRRRGEPF